MANIAEIVQPNTLNFFRKGQNKNSVGHSISDAFWQKIENKITMQMTGPMTILSHRSGITENPVFTMQC